MVKVTTQLDEGIHNLLFITNELATGRYICNEKDLTNIFLHDQEYPPKSFHTI